MAEREIAVTKEALHQYIIIRKLHMELEEEREASATAANEALSVILRLQREKAAEKMEACQYRRIAEEKMHHAEQSLIILEEEMQQKEFEILILKHQIKLYKTKLLSNGIGDLGSGNVVTSEDGALVDKTGLHGYISRNISLPPLRVVKLCSETGGNENSLLAFSEQTKWKRIGDCTDQLGDKNRETPNLFRESATDDYNSEEVDGEVKYESSPRRNGCQTTSSNSPHSSGKEFSSCSRDSTLTGDALCHSNCGTKICLDAEGASSLHSQAVKQVDTMESVGDSISHDQIESRRNANHLACVHDIFEVPESDKYHTSREPNKHFLEESIKESKTSVGTEDLVSQDTVESPSRDNDWLDRVVTHSDHSSGISTPTSQPDKLSAPTKGEMLNYNSVLVDSINRTCIMRNDFEHIKFQLQQIEYEKIMKMEDYERSNEQLKLLRDIYDKLNTIECHLQSSRSKKCLQHNESQLISVIENADIRSQLISPLATAHTAP
nr:PREDICTED: uncharacterized protein LOC103991954 isoform X3 [Musa acuminata subsp. malaccensis]